MDSIEVTAKKFDEALKEGLEKLSATIDDVDVKVLDAGGLFSKARLIVSLTEEVRRQREKSREALRARENRERPADEKFRQSQARQPQGAGEQERREPNKNKQDAGKNKQDLPRSDRKQENRAAEKQPQQAKEKPVNEQQKEQVKERAKPQMPVKSTAPSEVPEKAFNDVKKFLTETLKKMGVESEIKIEGHGFDLDVDLNTDDVAVIGWHGEALDSLEYLAGLVANRDAEKYIKLTLDACGYREKQIDSLLKYAEKMAAKCIKQGRKVCLDPMNSAARKVVHAALSQNDKVVTKSEGKEPNRRIVIYCKRERSE